MITIYTTTNKRAQAFWDAYHKSNKFSLIECYFNSCSNEKKRAEYFCRMKMTEENGYDFRILSYNTFQFTCGWMLRNGDLRVETAQNSYYIIDLPF